MSAGSETDQLRKRYNLQWPQLWLLMACDTQGCQPLYANNGGRIWTTDTAQALVAKGYATIEEVGIPGGNGAVQLWVKLTELGMQVADEAVALAAEKDTE